MMLLAVRSLFKAYGAINVLNDVSFVVNKGDRDGADTTVKDLQEWHHKVVRTVAIKGEGIPELIEAIAEHQRMTDLNGKRGM